MTSSPIRHVSLTISQKQKVVDEAVRRRLNGESNDQEALAQWAKHQFHLLRAPNQATISRLLRASSDRSLFASAHCIRLRHGACKELEESLHSWVTSQFAARRMVNSAMIKAAGKRILIAMNRKLSFDKEIKLKFSNGWLHNFQKRNNLRSLRCHGESGDADMVAVHRKLSFLRNTVSLYKPSDVFNADEFGHCYNAAPDRTIAEQRMAGRKKSKTRLTYLACCNADGSEKFPLFIIGKAARPRCFKKKSGAELGFDYDSNRRAWMTSSLFTAWLFRFSDYVTRTNDEGKVLLLVDNCSAHGSAESLPDLENVDVMFLPPNTTSKLQPLDAGTIAALKVRYRSWQYEAALDRIEINAKNVYAVDQLTAMKMVREIWDVLPSSVISNCWRHTGLIEHSSSASINDEGACEAVLDSVRQLVPQSLLSRISIEALVNPLEENDCIEEATEETLDENAAHALMSFSSGDVVDMNNDPEEQGFTQSLKIEERLKAVIVVKELLRGDQESCAPLRCGLRRLQQELIDERRSGLQQTSIDSFFSRIDD